MKKFLSLAAAVALTGAAHAQLATVPLPSSADGHSVTGADPYWAASSLAAYSFASDGNEHTPNMAAGGDNVSGLHWGSAVNSNVAANLADINVNGGSVRIIFVGESAGWRNDLGYTYDGNPASAQSFTIFDHVQAVAPGNNVTFGQHVDVSLSPGDASTFDIWLNAPGSDSPTRPAPASYFGGVYTAIHASNSTPYLWSGNSLWGATPLWVDTGVPTWIDASGHTSVATYLVGMEDWRLDRGADMDFNDMAIGLQFFHRDGTPFTPVPEPSTYGLIGAVALMGLVARRRFKK